METNLDGTTKNAYTDNIIFGKIFMAIDNLHSRCLEVNNAIKVPKKTIEKKVEKKEKAETDKKTDKDEKKENVGNDEFSQLLNVNCACRKLTMVMDNMVDFKEIINSQHIMDRDKKRRGVHK